MHTPSARASLVLTGLDDVLCHGACVERAVKRTLRAGGRLGVLTTNDQRAAAAEALFGVSMLRLRLSHLLSQTNPEARSGSLGMLALFLLHETPQLCDPAVLARELPAEALGLPANTLERLRSFEPRYASWPADPAHRLSTQLSLPPRLLRSWHSQLGSSWEEVALLGEACNTPGPVTLRANLARGGRADLRRALARDVPALRCSDGRLSSWALTLHGGRAAWGGSLWSLRAWGEGRFEAQDEGSQCVAAATEAAAGETVFDACAGNGGKTLALCAMVGPHGRVAAYDVATPRLRQLAAAAKRAGVAPRVQILEQPDAAPSCCDVALVDAPCSSSGVLRRHPGLRWSRDAAWHEPTGLGDAVATGGGGWDGAAGTWSDAGRDEGGVDELPALQLSLLRQAATRVRRGGRVVYATCALSREENQGVASAFEADVGQGDDDFVPWPFEEGVAGRDEAAPHQRTLWPHRHGTDGFFVARWRKL